MTYDGRNLLPIVTDIHVSHMLQVAGYCQSSTLCLLFVYFLGMVYKTRYIISYDS